MNQNRILPQRFLWRSVSVFVIALGLVACQQSNPSEVYVASPTPIRGALVVLEGVGADAVDMAAPLVSVSQQQGDVVTLAFVSEEAVSGELFAVPAGAKVRSSQVVTEDDVVLTGMLETRAGSANPAAIATAQNQAVTVAHDLDASFVNASLGDLDGNGFALVDIVNLLNIVVGNSTPADAFATYHADVTCDNVVNISDVLFVLRKFVGIEQAIPVCPPNLSLQSGQTQTILLGNSGVDKLTEVNIDLDVPAGMTVTDVSSEGTFGIALRVSATQSGVANVTIGGETVRVEVTVADEPTPTPTTITLRLVAADTQENAAITGLPLTGAPLVINP